MFGRENRRFRLLARSVFLLVSYMPLANLARRVLAKGRAPLPHPQASAARHSSYRREITRRHTPPRPYKTSVAAPVSAKTINGAAEAKRRDSKSAPETAMSEPATPTQEGNNEDNRTKAAGQPLVPTKGPGLPAPVNAHKNRLDPLRHRYCIYYHRFICEIREHERHLHAKGPV